MTGKNLAIQIQPELLSTHNKEQMVQAFVTFLNEVFPTNHCCVSSGDEDGAYINIALQSENVQELWKKIQSELSLNTDIASPIAKGIIVVCEGDKGWDDYLLLYHYDASELVDLFDNL